MEDKYNTLEIKFKKKTDAGLFEQIWNVIETLCYILIGTLLKIIYFVKSLFSIDGNNVKRGRFSFKYEYKHDSVKDFFLKIQPFNIKFTRNLKSTIIHL